MTNRRTMLMAALFASGLLTAWNALPLRAEDPTNSTSAQNTAQDSDRVPALAHLPAPYLPQSTPVVPATPLLTVPFEPAPMPSILVPQPGPMVGPMFVPPAADGFEQLPDGPLEDIAPGGSVSAGQFGMPSGPELAAGIPNPISVPVASDEYAWDQIVDVVSDYFRVAMEQRVVRAADMWTEGRIETAPQTGATLLEGQRGDSVGWFNVWESTFQTIRRRAVIHVIPDATGYLVEVEVHKEREDLHRPELASAGAATLRSDGSLPSGRADEVSRTRSSERWIPLGRDPALEQRILADIHARLTGAATGPLSTLVP